MPSRSSRARQGPGEVDARPSDALNLALVCDAPARVDATIFAHPDASSRGFANLGK
jgi:bifunctional DNase/RNase